MLIVYWYDNQMNVNWFHEDQPWDAVDLALTLAASAAGVAADAECEFRGTILDLPKSHSAVDRGAIRDVAGRIAAWIPGGAVVEGIVNVGGETFAFDAERDYEGGMTNVRTERNLFGSDLDRTFAALSVFAESHQLPVKAPLQLSAWNAHGERSMFELSTD